LLHEEILLSPCEDEEGSFHQRAYQPVLAAAVLASSFWREDCISADNDARRPVGDERPLEMALLDDVLSRIGRETSRLGEGLVSRINSFPG